MKFYCEFHRGADAPGVREVKRAEKQKKTSSLKQKGKIILLLTDSPEQLEIYSLKEYSLRRLYLRDGLIIGTGADTTSCVDYIYNLSKETYAENGTLDIRGFLLNRQEAKEKEWHS